MGYTIEYLQMQIIETNVAQPNTQNIFTGVKGVFAYPPHKWMRKYVFWLVEIYSDDLVFQIHSRPPYEEGLDPSLTEHNNL